jgi:hypothetical protein
MSQSLWFKRLVKRVGALQQELIPPTKPFGDYDQREQDLIRAYRLLVHAECEYYLEQITLKVAHRAARSYDKSGRPNKVLRALHQSFCRERILSKTVDLYKAALISFQDAVRHNHGLKEANLCRLILPLGAPDNWLDRTWLSTMSTFGTSRGEVAHTSASVARVPDPVTEVDLVRKVLAGIAMVDERLRKL